MDFLGYDGDDIVLARLLLDTTGDVGGSYRVKDFADSGDGRVFVAMLKIDHASFSKSRRYD